MNGKMSPAIMSGAALGVLTLVTGLMSAFTGFVGCCNCLWPIVAGALAVMLHVKKSPTPVQIMDGLMLGAITGLVAGLIYLIIGTPLFFLVIGTQMEQQLRASGLALPVGGFLLLLLGNLISLVIFVVLAAIGGLIGVPIFEKRKGDEGPGGPPPPPSGFGGGGQQPGGGFGGGQPGGGGYGGGSQPGGGQPGGGYGGPSGGYGTGQ